ncbi:glutamate--tRNA ligase [Anaerofustis stercorihominis]|uniref:Glutamate--tRNA ligase n=1 Tax=Anaerofustis stercorihominis TaxID=214853 RepID=A0A3E3DZE1_9FIRM|nr:glutamate--tRNA ligase [Anaerofustis stercorihominis]RGD74652.1 glutamate--tRNA ligase [Anaerofustis stercorihominis]
MNIRTRFAPSPTGFLHIGGLRTALYCYLWAKHNDGDYLLRIEDTDRTRYVEGSVENLINALNFCGVKHDEGPMLKDGKVVEVGEKGPYFQSDRLDIYKKYINKLLDEGKAYYCFCDKDRLEKLREEQVKNKQTPKYDGKCKNLSREEAEEKIKNGESYVIRMALPEDEDITFEDEVRGKVTINTKDVDEQVLIKADGFPTYHFAVVVDDHLMDVNYVIRGEEWLVSTPKHIILYNYLGWKPPKFAHLPTVLNKNKKKLSKRHDSVAVEDFIQKGYLPEALINYIALLGWSDPNDREILSMEELIKDFDISRVTKAGAVFDTEKLNWVNAHYIKEKSNEELIALIKPYLLNENLIDDSTPEEILIYIIEAIKDKLNYFEESIELTKELFLKADLNALDDNAKEIMDMETNETLFSNLVSLFEKEDSLTPEIVGKSLKSIQKEFKIKGKALYMPTRIAISGIMHGADLTYILSILGKDEVISRLKTAIEFIK